MKTISLSNFQNGIQPLRSQVSGGNSISRHYMLESTKLVPYRQMEAETLDGGMTMADKKLSSVIRYKCTGQLENIYALGQVSSVNLAPKFFIKSTINTPNVDFSALGSGESADGTVITGSLIGYGGALYCLKTKTGNTYLVKHVHGASTTDIGIVAPSPVNSIGALPKIFVHPKNDKLHIASGSYCATYDSVAGLVSYIFPSEYEIVSMTHFGNNTLLGLVSKSDGSSFVAVWDGNSDSTITDLINWGNDTLMLLENIGDVVVGISTMSVGGTSDVATQSFITFRYYNGGTAQTFKKIESYGGSRIYPYKVKRNDVLYFPMSAIINGQTLNQVWTVYKNDQGTLTVSGDRKVNGDIEVTDSFTGISMIGDWMWVAYGSSMMRTADQTSEYATTSSFETLVNPSMEVGDRSKKKSLKAISLRCGSPTGASHTVTVSYSVDGGAFTTIYTGTSSSEVHVIEEVAESTGKPFLEAREYIFKIESTGNCEIYEFKFAYDVIPSLI